MISRFFAGAMVIFYHNMRSNPVKQSLPESGLEFDTFPYKSALTTIQAEVPIFS